MAKGRDWNADVAQGSEIASSLRQGIVTANASTATPVVAVETDILWVVLQNLGTALVYFGSSTVANSGSSRGPRMTQNGETPVIKLEDLSKLYVISASGSQDIAYLAGVK